MKTILYNTQENKTVGKILEGSYSEIWNSALSKTPGWTPEYIVELEVVKPDQPEHDPKTQRVSSEWVADVGAKTYTLTWTVEDIPQEELDYKAALDDWRYPEWAKRIVAPVSLAMDDTGAKMYVWFKLNDMPVHKSGDLVYLYCNVILAEHQQIVDNLGDAVIIEDRPEILNNF